MKRIEISQRRLNAQVTNIVRQVASSKWFPDYIVGLTRGGLIPAVMLSNFYYVPCKTLKISFRDDQETEKVAKICEEAFFGKKILVVDDINDTGKTLNWLMEDWPKKCMPGEVHWKNVWNGNVKFAVLIDNLASKCNVKMDYVGEEINKHDDPSWIVFPWENWWEYECKID